MRKPIIVANWKMYKTLSEAVSFIEEIRQQIPKADQIDTVVCPPAIFLDHLVKASQGSDVKIGAQNMYCEDCGAFTGEISPVALADLKVDYVILGHSERRHLFNETDEAVQKKVHAAFKYGLTPIVCCGETLEQREAGLTHEIIQGQIEKALQGLTEAQMEQTVVAYEPIWAIGTGKSSSPEHANEVCHFIRSGIAKLFSNEIAEKVRIQYGGSVKPENIGTFMAQPDIDGALVGGASLEAASFLKLLEAGRNE